MRKTLATVTTLLSLSAIAHAANAPSEPRIPNLCIEQAKNIASATEELTVAPAYKDQLKTARLIIRSIKSATVYGGVNQWVFKIAFNIDMEDKYGNKSKFDVDTYNVTLTQNSSEDCYFEKTEAVR
jgi:hypothetical protein